MKKSREIFLSSGEPEGESQTRKREEEARIRLVEKTRKDPELQKILERVDFDTLRGIFEKIVERLGINPKAMNFIGSERISHLTSDWLVGSYSTYENIIDLWYAGIEANAEAQDIDPCIATIATLCHEEAHATARVECYDIEKWAPWPLAHIESGRLGYALWPKNKPSDRIFYLFNEGVTEKLGREVFREYLRITNYPDKEVVSAFERALTEKPNEMPYGVPVKFVDMLIVKICHETGVSNELVWNALVRGMYEGEEFNDPKLRELFAEMILPDFLDKLSQANSISQIEELMDTLVLSEKDASGIESIKQKILSWLNPILARIAMAKKRKSV